jgi:hypothetical protein
MPSSLHRPRRFAPIPLILLALAAGSAASAQPLPCSNATLKGTYLYSESGVLNGKPYAESGREVYDGRGGIVLSYQGSDGSGGVEKATYPDGQKANSFISPDGSRFVYTIRAAPGDQPTALSGSEVRVGP